MNCFKWTISKKPSCNFLGFLSGIREKVKVGSVFQNGFLSNIRKKSKLRSVLPSLSRSESDLKPRENVILRFFSSFKNKIKTNSIFPFFVRSPSADLLHGDNVVIVPRTAFAAPESNTPEPPSSKSGSFFRTFRNLPGFFVTLFKGRHAADILEMPKKGTDRLPPIHASNTRQREPAVETVDIISWKGDQSPVSSLNVVQGISPSTLQATRANAELVKNLRAEATLNRIPESNDINLSSIDCWMTFLPDKIRRIPLHSLYLPGSHDSFSYGIKGGELGPDLPGVVGRLAMCSPWLVRPAVQRWSLTQKANVLDQLLHGIRYFDIRVASKNGRFFFVHGLFGDDLELIMEQIFAFLKSRPSEVVIMDFQHFFMDDPNQHRALVSLIAKVFKGMLCSPVDTINLLTLEFMEQRGSQVVVFYRHSVECECDFLWPAWLITSPWPETTNAASLLTFLQGSLLQRPLNSFFVSQCILTPTVNYVTKHLFGSLEDMAIRCNEEVVKWLNDLDPEVHRANIVLTDFVEVNNWVIPQMVISKNVQYMTDKDSGTSDLS